MSQHLGHNQDRASSTRKERKKHRRYRSKQQKRVASENTQQNAFFGKDFGPEKPQLDNSFSSKTVSSSLVTNSDSSCEKNDRTSTNEESVFLNHALVDNVAKVALNDSKETIKTFQGSKKFNSQTQESAQICNQMENLGIKDQKSSNENRTMSESPCRMIHSLLDSQKGSEGIVHSLKVSGTTDDSSKDILDSFEKSTNSQLKNGDYSFKNFQSEENNSLSDLENQKSPCGNLTKISEIVSDKKLKDDISVHKDSQENENINVGFHTTAESFFGSGSNPEQQTSDSQETCFSNNHFMNETVTYSNVQINQQNFPRQQTLDSQETSFSNNHFMNETVTHSNVQINQHNSPRQQTTGSQETCFSNNHFMNETVTHSNVQTNQQNVPRQQTSDSQESRFQNNHFMNETVTHSNVQTNQQNVPRQQTSDSQELCFSNNHSRNETIPYRDSLIISTQQGCTLLQKDIERQEKKGVSIMSQPIEPQKNDKDSFFYKIGEHHVAYKSTGLDYTQMKEPEQDIDLKQQNQSDDSFMERKVDFENSSSQSSVDCDYSIMKSDMNMDGSVLESSFLSDVKSFCGESNFIENDISNTGAEDESLSEDSKVISQPVKTDLEGLSNNLSNSILTFSESLQANVPGAQQQNTPEGKKHSHSPESFNENREAGSKNGEFNSKESFDVSLDSTGKSLSIIHQNEASEKSIDCILETNCFEVGMAQDFELTDKKVESTHISKSDCLHVDSDQNSDRISESANEIAEDLTRNSVTDSPKIHSTQNSQSTDAKINLADPSESAVEKTITNKNLDCVEKNSPLKRSVYLNAPYKRSQITSDPFHKSTLSLNDLINDKKKMNISAIRLTNDKINHSSIPLNINVFDVSRSKKIHLQFVPDLRCEKNEEKKTSPKKAKEISSIESRRSILKSLQKAVSIHDFKSTVNVRYVDVPKKCKRGVLHTLLAKFFR